VTLFLRGRTSCPLPPVVSSPGQGSPVTQFVGGINHAILADYVEMLVPWTSLDALRKSVAEARRLGMGCGVSRV
jgi:hypothetical protein